MGRVYGGPGDDLVRGGTLERPDDGGRDVLDCGDGEDTAYFVDGQDTVRECENTDPPPE
jgi:Ca2+-binding RTX toxin-like protein